MSDESWFKTMRLLPGDVVTSRGPDYEGQSPPRMLRTLDLAYEPDAPVLGFCSIITVVHVPQADEWSGWLFVLANGELGWVCHKLVRT